MKIALAIAFGVTGLAVPERADAGSCNGGSSNDSSSDSSTDSSNDSSSDSSSSDSSTVSPVSPCLGDSDVHGHSRCRKFGTWGKTTAMPAFIIEFGTAVRQFASPLTTKTGSIEHDSESFTYRVVNPNSEQAQLDTAALVSFRVGFALKYGFYAAAEVETGTLTGSTRAEMTSAGERGMPDIRETSVNATSGFVVGGFRTRLGRLGFGVEAAGGFRVLSYTYTSNYHACESTTKILETMEVLEGRARAQYFVSPFVAVGATYGKSLIDDSWIGGLYIGGNTRAFGGH